MIQYRYERGLFMTQAEVLNYLHQHYIPQPPRLFHQPPRKPTYGLSYPKLKEISKFIIKSNPIEFLESNDFSIYELEILQTYVIGSLKDFHQAIHYFKELLPHFKEWSVIDSLCQRFIIAKKHPYKVLAMLETYMDSNDEYIERMIYVMALSHLLKGDAHQEAIELIRKLHHPGYYAKMGKAWALCEVMIRFPDQAFLILQEDTLDPWTHNKAIQKMLESYRIPQETKDKLKTMRI
jgi:3-methyladenine DNA glycosylase AlkD